jgi:hypothetical protein
MRVKVDHIEREESAIALDVAGANEIALMDIVPAQRLPEVGIINPFGGVRSFF